MAKLVCNGDFGRFIMDVACYREVKYEQDESKMAFGVVVVVS